MPMHLLPLASAQRATHAPRGSEPTAPRAPAAQADPRAQPLDDWLGGGLAAQLAQRRAAGAGAAPAGGGGADAGYDERALRLAVQDKVIRQLPRLYAHGVWLPATPWRTRAGLGSWRALGRPGGRLLWALAGAALVGDVPLSAQHCAYGAQRRGKDGRDWQRVNVAPAAPGF